MVLQISQDELNGIVDIAKDINPMAAKYIKSVTASNQVFEVSIDTDTQMGKVDVRIELGTSPGG